MIGINNVTVSGMIIEQPTYTLLEETQQPFAVIKIHHSNYDGDKKKHSFTIKVKAFGNIADYIDTELMAGDSVLVSGVLCTSNMPYNGGYVAMPYIKALAVTKLEQEKYL